MKTSHVLVVSAHAGLLDRRIIAEIDSLAESGRAVTFVSTPVEIPEGALHPAVRLVVAPGGSHELNRRAGWLRSCLAFLGPCGSRPVRQWIKARRLKARERFFLNATPHAAYDAIHCHDLDTLPAAQALRHHVSPRARLIYDSHELFPYQEQDR